MTTIEIIKELCKKENITIQALEMELGEKRTSIASANSNMKAEKLYKIASYFGVSMEYIMGKPDLTDNKNHYSDFEREIILAYRKADDFDKTTVIRTLHLEGKEKEMASGG